ncbi:MAG: tRNA uridine-5-carboxymethylaminomethyl(34) synthesis GTPase MnmE [Rhodospirillaceae bacterium]
MNPETIYALATARGRAGIAIVRLSGADSMATARALSGRDLVVRRAQRVDLRDPAGGELLDHGLAIYFPGPASFTGEDVVELHLHGGAAVVAGVLAALAARPGLRMADPGEFTRRGFLNGKLDLTAAEGVADLVAAETAAQRRQALSQMGGALAEFCDTARARLVSAMARWEAAIDFAEDELPAGLEAEVAAEAAGLAADIRAALADDGRGERLRDGIEVAIVGPPNAGKSSLLNRIARRDAAIVSATAGTTRDVIEVQAELGGYPVILADTAGLRDAADEIEREGVRRALERAERADLRLIVLDGASWPEIDAASRALIGAEAVVALNKFDLLDASAVAADGVEAMAVSARTGAGVEALLDRIEAKVAALYEGQAAPVVTRARHREALADALAALERFGASRNRLARPELAAEDLRMAARALGRVTGAVDVEDLLEVIFSEFCIGK